MMAEMSGSQLERYRKMLDRQGELACGIPFAWMSGPEGQDRVKAFPPSKDANMKITYGWDQKTALEAVKIAFDSPLVVEKCTKCDRMVCPCTRPLNIVKGVPTFSKGRWGEDCDDDSPNLSKKNSVRNVYSVRLQLKGVIESIHAFEKRDFSELMCLAFSYHTYLQIVHHEGITDYMKTWRLTGDLMEVDIFTVFYAYSINYLDIGTTQEDLPYSKKWFSSKVYIADGMIRTLILPNTFFSKFDSEKTNQQMEVLFKKRADDKIKWKGGELVKNFEDKDGDIVSVPERLLKKPDFVDLGKMINKQQRKRKSCVKDGE